MSDKIRCMTPEFRKMHNDFLTEWRQLDPITRGEHVLSNSILYQRSQYLEEWERTHGLIEYDADTDQYYYRVKT